MHNAQGMRLVAQRTRHKAQRTMHGVWQSFASALILFAIESETVRHGTSKAALEAILYC